MSDPAAPDPLRSSPALRRLYVLACVAALVWMALLAGLTAAYHVGAAR